jgi:hypothetical protein
MVMIASGCSPSFHDAVEQADVVGPRIFAFVGEDGVARADDELRKSPECANAVFGQGVGEIILLQRAVSNAPNASTRYQRAY